MKGSGAVIEAEKDEKTERELREGNWERSIRQKKRRSLQATEQLHSGQTITKNETLFFNKLNGDIQAAANILSLKSNAHSQPERERKRGREGEEKKEKG